MHVSPARPADVGRLMFEFAGLYGAMIAEAGLAGSGFVEGWQERLAAVFRWELQRGAMAVYLVQAEGRVVASAAIFTNDLKSNVVLRDRSGTIAGVYVLPAFRRRGLARRLTERAIDWGRRRGFSSIRLTASKPAADLYRSLGFEDGRELVLRF